MEKDFPDGSEGSDEGLEEEPWSAGVPEGTPKGFGFRTGKRSPRVAYGFAVFALVLGTVLLVLVEAAFIAGFRALARQARQRRDG